jgi:hypothetical protein
MTRLRGAGGGMLDDRMADLSELDAQIASTAADLRGTRA